jgi:DNA-directed RNA polymerase specialized sigma24 family protein
MPHPEGFSLIDMASDITKGLDLTSDATDDIVINLKKAKQEGKSPAEIKKQEEKLIKNILKLVILKVNGFTQKPDLLSTVRAHGGNIETLREDLVSDCLEYILKEYDGWDSPHERASKGESAVHFTSWLETVLQRFLDHYFQKEKAQKRDEVTVSLSEPENNNVSVPEPVAAQDTVDLYELLSKNKELIKKDVLAIDTKQEKFFYIMFYLLMRLGLGSDVFEEWQRKPWLLRVNKKKQEITEKIKDLDLTKCYSEKEIYTLLGWERQRVNLYNKHAQEWLKTLFNPS